MSKQANLIERYVERCAAYRAEVAALRRLLLECAEDLEADVKDRYGWPDVHPAQKRKFERDMELVTRARKAAKGEEP